MPKYMVITKGDGEVWAAFFDSITEAEDYKMDGECGMGFYAEVYERDEELGEYQFLYS